MVEATLAEAPDKVAQMLEHVHDREIPFCSTMMRMHYHVSLRFVICMHERILLLSGRQRAEKDTVIICFAKKHGKPTIILELKVDDTCESAIAQIKSRII